MQLSILIPTVPERAQVLERLTTELYRQISACNANSLVEVLVHETPMMFNGGDHTGKKRNHLLSIAKGEYVTFIDDDDMVTDCFISEVLKAAETGCDVMGMKGWITENGGNRIEFNIAIENGYELVGNIYFRHPNHITPMKRSIALQVGFPDISHGEDYDFSVRLKNMGLCKTQTYIVPPIYHYDYSTFNKIHP